MSVVMSASLFDPYRSLQSLKLVRGVCYITARKAKHGEMVTVMFAMQFSCTFLLARWFLSMLSKLCFLYVVSSRTGKHEKREKEAISTSHRLRVRFICQITPIQSTVRYKTDQSTNNKRSTAHGNETYGRERFATGRLLNKRETLANSVLPSSMGGLYCVCDAPALPQRKWKQSQTQKQWENLGNEDKEEALKHIQTHTFALVCLHHKAIFLFGFDFNNN